MINIYFIKKQLKQIQKGGFKVFIRKIKILINNFTKPILFILAFPVVLTFRIIKPWILIRIGCMFSSRIGHFAANTEMYLCERDLQINTPKYNYIDIFYMVSEPPCNQQLAIMWKKLLRIWPAWLLEPIYKANKFIPGGEAHEIGQNSQHDRDVHNLLDKIPPHLQFTSREEVLGKAGLRKMGVPEGRLFICLNVRDSAYLAGECWAYHNYRDSNIQNYVLAADFLASQGYFIIRMGAKVHEAINSKNPNVIDYATNGMRSDFMDIYLGAKCHFAISTQTGWDSVPYVFRRPICYVNALPIGYLHTFSKNFLLLTKRHLIKENMSEMTCAEIFSSGLGFCNDSSQYEAKGVVLVENTPQEILDVVEEMAKRLDCVWQAQQDDEFLQWRFWQTFPADSVDAYVGKPLHGKINARFGANYLRNNRVWVL